MKPRKASILLTPLKDISVPFAVSYHPALVALGILGFYLMVILSFSSYLRKIIPRRLWRTLRYLNVTLYVFVAIHALYLGTDFKDPVFRNIFLFANGFLALMKDNDMLARLLADYFKVSRSQIKIIGGKTAKMKLVGILN